MGSFTPPDRTAHYKPALAAFAALACAWIFVLVTLGAFTTSINAGMAFPDWPLSNGSLNPKGWLSNVSMFAEHSHRLSAGMETTLALILAIWVWRKEARPWLRKLAWTAFGVCMGQAVIGGLRVLLNYVQLPAWDTNLGEVIAMLHAWLAQALACVFLAVAVSLTRSWIDQRRPVSPRVLLWGRICCALLFINLAIAAVMRHTFAGLAIPYFPFSTIDHHLLPPFWPFKVAIHFAHRVTAMLIFFSAIVYALVTWRDPGASDNMKTAAAGLVSLLLLQICLGATIIWTFREPFVTTAHVLVGAITLVSTFWLTWAAHRDRIQT
ncbi:MAG TPA: COX15/CtaA family protein [Opitutaceae bacterium]|jgi:cytochrome c oxidase assembly protein subunit 15